PPDLLGTVREPRPLSRSEAQDHDPGALRRAIDQAPEAIVVADVSGRIEYLNASAQALIGRTQAGLLGRHFSAALGAEDAADRYAGINEAVSRGRSWAGTITAGGGDGVGQEIGLSVSPVADESGTVTSFLAIGRPR